jgi:hypothetical protein
MTQNKSKKSLSNPDIFANLADMFAQLRYNQTSSYSNHSAISPS